MSNSFLRLIILRVIFSTFLAQTFILAQLFFAPRLLAQSGPEVVKLMGQAEILSAGKWRPAKTGDFIKPGDAILVIGEGEASLSSDEGQVTVNVKTDTMVSYDGDVDPNSRPWNDGQPTTAASAPADQGGRKARQFSVSKGEAEMTVVPGQPLRVVTPLIAAAVRGTHFIVSVAVDGSSSLSTIEGQVLALSRTGVSQLVGAGGSVQLTSGQYATFLQQSGVNVPSGNWQGLDAGTLDKLDPQTFSDAVSSSGGEAGAGSGSATSTPTTSTTTPTTSAASTPTTTATTTPTTATSSASTSASTSATTSASTSASTSAATSTATTATSATTSTATGAATGVATGTGTVGSATASTVGSVIAQAAPSVGSAAAMGTAGVTTGSLTGEGTQAKPVDNVGTLLGNITVIDPGTGLPEDSFTANDQGEVFIGIQGAPGQTEVAINIGGQDYLVDLAPVQGNAQVILDYVNFNDPATGYQSVATVTPFFGGLTPTNPVTWTVESIRNPTHPWWLRSGTSYAGLTWGLAADPAAYTGAGNWPDTVRGTAPTGPVAQITDVVGSRSVTLKAETTIDGVMYSETMDVTFGPGPLSVFRTAPAVGVKWARSAGNAATAADPGNDGNMLALNGNSGADFPAAVQICGGSINVSAITSTTTVPGSHNAGFDYTPGSGWEQDIKWASLSRALNSKLPHYDQLIAVSMYSTTHNPGIPRKGAALAAGWPDDGLGAGVYRYWSNPINMMGPGYFLATNVGLRVGAEETSNRVNYNIPNVVCVF